MAKTGECCGKGTLSSFFLNLADSLFKVSLGFAAGYKVGPSTEARTG